MLNWKKKVKKKKKTYSRKQIKIKINSYKNLYNSKPEGYSLFQKDNNKKLLVKNVYFLYLVE